MRSSDGRETIFSGCNLSLPGVLAVVGPDADQSLAVVLAALGFETELVRETGFEVDWLRPIQSPFPFLRRQLLCPNARGEISMFWDTVLEEVVLGQERGFVDESSSAIMTTLDIAALVRRRPTALSGGETVRIILASHLLARPQILVVDRALEELDVGTRRLVLEQIRSLVPNGLFVVVGHMIHEMADQTWEVSGADLRILAARQTDQSHGTRAGTRHLDFVVNRARRSSEDTELIVEGFSVSRGGLDVFGEQSLHARAGDLVWVLGPNGCGKTTFFEAVLGWLPPNAGSVRLLTRGQEIELRGAIAYAPQDPEEDITEETLDGELVLATSVSGYQSLRPLTAAMVREWIRAEAVNESLVGYPLRNSIALQKLASVLAAFLRGHLVCFLDEPTLWIPSQWRSVVVRGLIEYLSRGGIVFCATHDDAFIEAVRRAWE